MTLGSTEMAHVPVEDESNAKALFFWSCVSLLVLWLGPFTNYSPIGSLDPWFYTGYFTNFRQMATGFGLLYYPSRLPYILFGASVYALFSPIVANFLINLSMLACGSFALYRIGARNQDRWVAALAALAFCVNPYVMSSIAWDYPDGPAIALVLLGLWLVLAPPRRLRGRLGMFFVGSLWAMAGFTNLIAGLIILPGVFLIAYVRHFVFKTSVRDFLFVGLGVGVTTAVFMIISQRIFGDYRFYAPQFNMLVYMESDGRFQQMWGSGWGFLKNGYRLGATYGLTLAGGWLLLRHFERLKSDRFYIGTYWFLLLCDALFIFVEFGMKAVVLRVAYTSSYLVIPVFLFLVALLGALRKIAGEPSFRVTVVAIAGILVAMLAPICLISRFHPPAGVQPPYWGVVIGIGSVGLVASSLAGRLRSAGAGLAAACFVLLLTLPTAVDPALSYVFADGRPGFEAAMRTQNVLTSGFAKDRTLRFWFDTDEQWTPLFHSIASLYLWGGWRDYSHLMPTMPADDLRWLFPANTTVIHLTTTPAKVAERTRLLASRNIVVEDAGNWTIKTDKIEFQVVVQNVRDVTSLK
jgi:hypothetical protein